jgi:hypothetical protein
MDLLGRGMSGRTGRAMQAIGRLLLRLALPVLGCAVGWLFLLLLSASPSQAAPGSGDGSAITVGDVVAAPAGTDVTGGTDAAGKTAVVAKPARAPVKASAPAQASTPAEASAPATAAPAGGGVPSNTMSAAGQTVAVGASFAEGAPTAVGLSVGVEALREPEVAAAAATESTEAAKAAGSRVVSVAASSAGQAVTEVGVVAREPAPIEAVTPPIAPMTAVAETTVEAVTDPARSTIDAAAPVRHVTAAVMPPLETVTTPLRPAATAVTAPLAPAITAVAPPLEAAGVPVAVDPASIADRTPPDATSTQPDGTAAPSRAATAAIPADRRTTAIRTGPILRRNATSTSMVTVASTAEVHPVPTEETSDDVPRGPARDGAGSGPKHGLRAGDQPGHQVTTTAATPAAPSTSPGKVARSSDRGPAERTADVPVSPG